MSKIKQNLDKKLNNNISGKVDNFSNSSSTNPLNQKTKKAPLFNRFTLESDKETTKDPENISESPQQINPQTNKFPLTDSTQSGKSSANKDDALQYTGELALNNTKWERFVRLYVTSPFNIGSLYREAGYTVQNDDDATSKASKLLTDVRVKARLNYLRKLRDERLGRDPQNVVEGLFNCRDRCAEGQLVVDRQGKPITQEIDIKGVKQKVAVLWKFDHQGFNRASELLGKYFGILTDSVVVDDKRAITKKFESEAEDVISSMNIDIKSIYNPIQGVADGSTSKEYPTDEQGRVKTEPLRHVAVLDEKGVDSREKRPDAEA